MAFRVIDNPDAQKFRKQSGFRNFEYRQLAGLFSRGASARALYDIAVDVDFDAGTCTFTYFRSNAYRPYLQFVIRHIGPRADMYELYKEGEGRVTQSALFERVFSRLEDEVTALTEAHAT